MLQLYDTITPAYAFDNYRMEHVKRLQTFRENRDEKGKMLEVWKEFILKIAHGEMA